MNERLLAIIKYKTRGRQNAFAAMMGWTPQYLGKLVHGENFGLQPVLAIVEKLPEINARWLLTGEGCMLADEKLAAMRSVIFHRVKNLLEAANRLDNMSPEELSSLDESLSNAPSHKSDKSDKSEV